MTIKSISGAYDNGSINLGDGNDTLTIHDSLNGTLSTFNGANGYDTLVLSKVKREDWDTGIKNLFVGFESIELKDGVLELENNIAPLITGFNPNTDKDNKTYIGEVLATDANNDAIDFSLSGVDADFFTLTYQGFLSFLSEPLVEVPLDDGANNIYDFNILATDIHEAYDSKSVKLKVTKSDLTMKITPIVGRTPVGGVAGPVVGREDLNVTIKDGIVTCEVPEDFDGDADFYIVFDLGNGASERVDYTCGPSSPIQTVVRNQAPVADAQSVTVAKNSTDNTITLTATDAEGDDLTYSLGDDVTNGTLSIVDNVVTYTPNTDSVEADSFTFTVNDGSVDSQEVTVSINVHLSEDEVNNHAPIITGVNPNTDKDNKTYLGEVVATDADNDAIDFSLSGVDASFFTITYEGLLSFLSEPLVEVPLDDGANNIYDFNILATDIHEAYDSKSVKLKVTNSDLTMKITPIVGRTPVGGVAGPVVGRGDLNVTIKDGIVTCEVPEDFDGDADFYIVFDLGNGASERVDYTCGASSPIQTVVRNQAPVADAQSVTVAKNSTDNTITLTATDAEGDDLTYSLGDDVTNGTLSLVNNVATYSPSTDYTGEDTFTFKANDGTLDSATVTVTITVTPTVTARNVIKKTGQTSSYNASGTEVTDSSLKDDAYYQTGVTPQYTRASDIVTDELTGLMWQDDAAAASVRKQWQTTENYNAGDYNNTTGDTATSYCSAMNLGGYDDWRLPTRSELKGIVDYSSVYPAIDTDSFTNTSSYVYWSSSTYEYSKYLAWVVRFSYGNVYADGKSNSYPVRCVREGQ